MDMKKFSDEIIDELFKARSEKFEDRFAQEHEKELKKNGTREKQEELNEVIKKYSYESDEIIHLFDLFDDAHVMEIEYWIKEYYKLGLYDAYSLQNKVRPAASCLRRESAGGGLSRNQCGQDAVRRRHHLRCSGRYGRLCLCRNHRQLLCKRRCGRIRLPCPGCHDLRQLEAPQCRRRGTAFRFVQMHCRLLLDAGYQRGRRFYPGVR